MIKYEIITTEATIIDQIDRFLKNTFNFEFELKNSGRIKNKIAIKNIAGIISSNPIFNYSKNFLLFEKIF